MFCLQVGSAPSLLQLNKQTIKSCLHHTQYLKSSLKGALCHTSFASQLHFPYLHNLRDDEGSFPHVPVILTRSPDVQISIQHVSKLQRALSEVCFCHGAQILPVHLLKQGADLRQPVQVLGPEQPLLNVHTAPVQRVWRGKPKEFILHNSPQGQTTWYNNFSPIGR